MPHRPDDPRIDARTWESASPRALLERCRALRAEGYDVVFCAFPQETAVVGTRLAEEGLSGSPVVESHLHGGFVSPALALAVVTHTEWHARPPAPSRPQRPSRRAALGELHPGDVVVHSHHGIGRYVGMETREVAGFVREYLVIEYAAGRPSVRPDRHDRIAAALHRIGRAESLALGHRRLGTRQGSRPQACARHRRRSHPSVFGPHEARRDTASRWTRRGSASSPSPFPSTRRPTSFERSKTSDGDMHRELPMDRLVCGDVGFGKTEVAVRAAFKAIVEGKQVAVLVPTTLLAQQHYATFSDRFEPFPVKVAMLSRFVDASHQQDVVAQLATGEVDVVIGTHRLLSSDIKFHDLGLLIIDEEHRFGVAQKEKLRNMRVDVDVLTLTATPIPRTLEMSMSGIRDLSIIDTAPADRRPVRTFVGPFDERLLTAAIRRELSRGGQVFVVHNRVQSIGRELRRLQRLVPEARIGVGHGQMDPERLERAMIDFWEQRTDVFLCTTIIEAGLDIPTVNTLDRGPGRPARPRAAVPAARPSRPGWRAGLRVPLLSAEPPADADRARAAQDARAVHGARLRHVDRHARPRDPRRGQHAGGRAARPHRGRRIRDVREAAGGCREGTSRHPERRSRPRYASTFRSMRTSQRPSSTASRCGSRPTAGSQRPSARPTSKTRPTSCATASAPCRSRRACCSRSRDCEQDLREHGDHRRIDRAARAVRTGGEASSRPSRPDERDRLRSSHPRAVVSEATETLLLPVPGRATISTSSAGCAKRWVPYSRVVRFPPSHDPAPPDSPCSRLCLCGTSCSTLAVAAATVNGDKITEAEVETSARRACAATRFSVRRSRTDPDERGRGRRDILTQSHLLHGGRARGQAARDQADRADRSIVSCNNERRAKVKASPSSWMRRTSPTRTAGRIAEQLVREFALQERVLRGIEINDDDVSGAVRDEQASLRRGPRRTHHRADRSRRAGRPREGQQRSGLRRPREGVVYRRRCIGRAETSGTSLSRPLHRRCKAPSAQRWSAE